MPIQFFTQRFIYQEEVPHEQLKTKEGIKDAIIAQSPDGMVCKAEKECDELCANADNDLMECADPKYREASKYAESDPTRFFGEKGYEQYPHLLEKAAKSAAKENPGLVLAHGEYLRGVLGEKASESIKTALQNAVKTDPRLVIDYINLHPDGSAKDKLYAKAKSLDPIGAGRYA